MNPARNRKINPPGRARWVIRHGIVGGIIAGIVFAIGEMVISLAMRVGLFSSFRLIGSMILGTQALEPSYPLLTAAGVGFLVHVILSMIFGVIFFFLLALFRQLNASTLELLVYGLIYGMVLWINNFLLIAPAAFPQLTAISPLWNVFFVHTFLYGMVIGAYAAILHPRQNEIGSTIPVTGKEENK
jgi:hypothetical protein